MFIIYIYAIFLIRIGNRRFNLQTSFDFVLVIIMGSILSRAINGSSPLVASMAASSVIIFLHWLFAFGAFQHHKIGIVHHDDLRQVKAARLERTGKLSFILNASKP